MMATHEHWDKIYTTGDTQDLGWYEPSPSTFEFVLRFSTPAEPIIDIGGGDSAMVDELIGAGYEDVTVLDLSSAALERSRHRLGPVAETVNWISADITAWKPPRTWSLWHDRAVFHFLTTEADRRLYFENARRAVAPGGHLIIATFAPDGPEQCAGLPVVRYDIAALVDAFAPDFGIVEHAALPGQDVSVGDRRPYIVAVLRRQ